MPDMSTEQAIEHGRRWLAAGWRWAPGQVAIASKGEHTAVILVTDVRDGAVVGLNQLSGEHLEGWPSVFVPDLRDEGTRGHMLGQVRKAWGDAYTIILSRSTRWSLVRILGEEDREDDDDGECFGAVHEGEALLAAYKAAPFADDKNGPAPAEAPC